MPNRRLFNTNLTWLTVSIILGTTLSIQILFSAWLYTRQRSIQYGELAVQLEQVSEQASRNLVSGVWNFDSEEIRRVVDNYMLLPSLAKMTVRDLYGNVVVERGETVESTDRYRRSVDIRQEGELIGSLEVFLSTVQTEQRLRHNLIGSLATIVVVAVVQMISLYIFFRRSIIQPVRALSSYAGAVGERRQPLPLPPQGRFVGELEELRESMLSMVDDLSTSEKKYRLIFENSLEAIYQTTIDGCFKKVNPAFAKMVGYETPDELVAAVTDVKRQLYAEGANRKVFIDRIRQGEDIVGAEVNLLHRDGSLLECLMSMHAIRDEAGNIRYLEGAIMDITARKRAERELAAMNRDLEALVESRTAELNARNQELKASEKRYRDLVESMQEGILLLDRDSRLIYTNPQFGAMLGVDHRELVGTACSRFLDAENEQLFERRIRENIDKDNGKFEIAFTRPDGKTVSALVTPTRVESGERDYDGAFAVVTDITNLKQLQSQLLQAQKLESIGQLAAGIAHEINTPTQYVINNVTFLQDVVKDLTDYQHALDNVLEAVRRGADGPDVLAAVRRAEEEGDSIQAETLLPEISDAFRDIFDGLGRIAGIVSSVKRFAELDQDEAMLTDVNEAIKSTIDIAASQWKYVAKLETNLDESLPPLFCVASGLNQVLLNLIVNAALAIKDACSAAGQDVARGAEEPQGIIRVESCKREEAGREYIEIRVTDTGNGIPEEIRERIFDPFFTTREVGSGSGQGLAIARNIVDGHHGTIRFETEPGRGTTFIVQLPHSNLST